MNKMYALAAVAFGLLAWSGAGALDDRVPGLAVPFLVVGLGGCVGATALLAAARWRAVAVRLVVRLVMGGAAVVAFVAGAVLAPLGDERVFVLVVDAVVAGSLAAFALLSGRRLPAAV
ncbi:hypothetical protein [Actinoplanes sp. NPDC051494]|uniref:hypothetical protein n=1 Tax=Actinoplanes sp. NPDC051494 TaxID=3363907 RepID=UPI0037ABC0CD